MKNKINRPIYLSSAEMELMNFIRNRTRNDRFTVVSKEDMRLKFTNVTLQHLLDRGLLVAGANLLIPHTRDRNDWMKDFLKTGSAYIGISKRAQSAPWVLI